MNKADIAKELDMSVAELETTAQRNQHRALGRPVERGHRDDDAFARLSKEHPKPGSVLVAKNGESVEVVEDWKNNEGRPVRILLVNAAIDLEATGWYLHSKSFGLKCLIMLRSHEQVSKDGKGLFVNKLSVVRETKSGTALLCDVID